jgi:hypothetical protein
MDEGAARGARAMNVRVEMNESASAALGRPVDFAGRKVPAATPIPERGRFLVGGKYLMQRQPWWPAKSAGSIHSAQLRGRVSIFRHLPIIAASICDVERQPLTAAKQCISTGPERTGGGR